MRLPAEAQFPGWPPAMNALGSVVAEPILIVTVSSQFDVKRNE